VKQHLCCFPTSSAESSFYLHSHFSRSNPFLDLDRLPNNCPTNKKRIVMSSGIFMSFFLRYVDELFSYTFCFFLLLSSSKFYQSVNLGTSLVQNLSLKSHPSLTIFYIRNQHDNSSICSESLCNLLYLISLCHLNTIHKHEQFSEQIVIINSVRKQNMKHVACRNCESP